MEGDRYIVQRYFFQGLTGAQIFKLVQPLGIKRRFVYLTIQRIRETGSIKNRPKSGRPKGIRTKECIKRIREKIRRNPRRSGRKLAKQENVSLSSMQRLLKIDLGLKPYKKRKLHGLSSQQMVKRHQRAKALLKRHGAEGVKKIVFSDEKLFVVEEKFNAQNHRIYAMAIEDVPKKIRNVQRFQNKSSTMVWAGVGYNGKIPLKFIKKGVKINSRYYIDEILQSTVDPNVYTLYPDGDFIFQQDSAPAHMAKVTQQWLDLHFPGFIATAEWPPSSPDCNPLDYFVWGYLEEKVNSKIHRSIESLERCLEREWKKMDIDLVRAAIDSWRRRLALVVKHKGDRFE